MASHQVTGGLAKVLGIKLDERDTADKLTRGESVFSVSSADTYVEEEPTVLEWFQSIVPSGSDVLHYVKSLFPFLSWIDRYNLQWLYGDLVAGKSFNARFHREMADHPRYHRRRCRRASGNGLREVGPTPG